MLLRSCTLGDHLKICHYFKAASLGVPPLFMGYVPVQGQFKVTLDRLNENSLFWRRWLSYKVIPQNITSIFGNTETANLVSNLQTKIQNITC